MYAVIFRARIAELDGEYRRVAARMRELATEKYGCKEFVSVTEGDEEIAISYWEDERQIAAWKEDTEHCRAQELGRSTWYRSYHVQVVEIKREYGKGA